jgi:hypothetical protein
LAEYDEGQERERFGLYLTREEARILSILLPARAEDYRPRHGRHARLYVRALEAAGRQIGEQLR